MHSVQQNVGAPCEHTSDWVQDCSISIANAPGILQSCTKPSIHVTKNTHSRRSAHNLGASELCYTVFRCRSRIYAETKISIVPTLWPNGASPSVLTMLFWCKILCPIGACFRIGNYTFIGVDNGLSAVVYQDIVWTKHGLLLLNPSKYASMKLVKIH